MGGGNENDAAGDDAAKRARRRSSKRSELELLLQLDGGTLAASAEFRRANALRPRDNILPGSHQTLQPPRPPPEASSCDALKTSVVSADDTTQDRHQATA